MPVQTLLRASLLALALLPALGALPADADDGRPQSGEAGHPPSPIPIPKSQLRPSAIQTAPIPSVAPESFSLPPRAAHAAAKKELVIFVGGIGSSREQNDAVCANLRTWFDPDRYEIACFGDDPAFPFDTSGPIDDSARTLIAQIRSRPSEYSSVDIIGHSMGGVVVDRAITDGLSAEDGVAVSIDIASPHNGSKFARVATEALPVVTPVADIIRAEVLRTANNDPGSAAARDLASFRPVRPPARIVRLDLGLANDVLVPTDDSRDPGIEQRLYLPRLHIDVHDPKEVFSEVDGHGGSLRNGELRSVVVEAIETRRIPPDHRSLATLLLVPVITPIAQQIGWLVLGGLLLTCCLFAAVMRLPVCRPLLESLHAKATSFLRAHGR
jgi:PGAP1-like protein